MKNGRCDRFFYVRDLEYPGGGSADGHTKQVQPVLGRKRNVTPFALELRHLIRPHLGLSKLHFK